MCLLDDFSEFIDLPRGDELVDLAGIKVNDDQVALLRHPSVIEIQRRALH